MSTEGSWAPGASRGESMRNSGRVDDFAVDALERRLCLERPYVPTAVSLRAIKARPAGI